MRGTLAAKLLAEPSAPPAPTATSSGALVGRAGLLVIGAAVCTSSSSQQQQLVVEALHCTAGGPVVRGP